MPNIRAAARAARREAERNGLHPRAAQLHAWATAVAAYYGFREPGRPDIISGYRSPCKQRELINRWRAGDRKGLAAEPAERSWHMHEDSNGDPASLAWDVQTNVRGFSTYSRALDQLGTVKVGGEFGDTGHFALPLGNLPPVATCDTGFFGF